jgi:nicotinate dehydrogenase subunit B
VFARKSHIDVMAVKAGLDPMEFRMRNLTDARMRRVLETAARKFGWSPKPRPSGRDFGVACGDAAATYVATMAEVKVDKSTGMVRAAGSRVVQLPLTRDG